jgi:O-methyltransferase
MSLKQAIKKNWTLLYIWRKIYYAPKDIPAAVAFLLHTTASPTTFYERLNLIFTFYNISYRVNCPHTEHELLTIAKLILNLGDKVPGVIVEAGSFYGGSSAKLSLVAKLCNRQLMIFDSFEGMPENTEEGGKSIFGREHHFPKGSHAVSLDTVKNNVKNYGDISRCTFYKGWLQDTLAQLKEPVAAACLNVDLLQSTKDCLHFLYPLMSPGGVIISQDGHFPWIIDLLGNNTFWQNNLGTKKPFMEGLGTSKFVVIWPSK